MGNLVGTAKIFPVVAELFKQSERKKKVEEIMSGRWLPNTPTAEVAFLFFVSKGLPIPEDMANTIYDEFLKQQSGKEVIDPFVVGVRKDLSDENQTASSDTERPSEEPSVVMASDEPQPTVGAKEAERIALETLRQLGFSVPNKEVSSPSDSPRLSIPEGVDTQPPSAEVRQVDPFIRMLQTALVMRILGATGGAFGALALAPILKELFDEMMDRKKRDTGQGENREEAKPRATSLVSDIPQVNKENITHRPPVDVLVVELQKEGLSPQQIALVVRRIIPEVELTPQQVEQILNNSGLLVEATQKSPLFELADQLFRYYTDPNTSPFANKKQGKQQQQKEKRKKKTTTDPSKTSPRPPSQSERRLA